ncbi:hypothetical protein JO972_11025 [Verrucomicrobiaceae bacterium 5K15]|uniref:Uncharacterized protein n=1 Tax=Oceaniferula flava TaxID=2800421 RepID=A0AAE2V9P6_9BACT|nr:ABC-three component system middle component 6 [Oceaniferula flavus]MBK1855493.1 hypothetical protein [Oceaniferula flavus]MBM1136799.1 hypothetical protein [Oceaniferula flavus]
MIVGKDTHPERKVYYWGALVLEVLSSSKEDHLNSFAVYENLKSNHDISAELFLLTLDWLYLVGAIDGEKGRIQKCF